MTAPDSCPAPAPASFSQDARKKAALAHLEEYLSRPIDDKPFVGDDTLKERDRLWCAWTQFCDDTRGDSRNAWLTFVKHPETSEGQAPFRAFLRTYVETSVQRRPVLDSREYEWKRMVNSAFSLTEVWRRIVASAENHIMRHQRKDYPSQAETWRLRWISKDEGSRQGPAYRIVRWIFVELAPEIGLETVPTYQKTEMTSTDVGVALDTLWLRANDIPCKPITRVSFHAMVLLAAIGGFRPGTLVNLTYSQFQVAVLRHPDNPARTTIVITISIRRNKIKETSKTSRSRAGGCISFSITLLPTVSCCLASLVLTRAIQEDAFNPSFTTIDEIFDRPNLESVNFVPLRWKDKFHSQPIFPMTYKYFNELWHRTLLVAGFRNHARLYSLRVGAGARFDGVLSSALRNHILSHTTSVFESNYQTHRTRADLMSLAFGNGTGRDEQLFAMLRDMSMSRDANAPVDITAEEYRRFEQRNDLTTLRYQIDNASDSKERSQFRSKVNYLLKILSQLQLDKNRAEYFERVDCLRAQGVPTDEASPSDSDSCSPSLAITTAVSRLLKSPVEREVVDCDIHSRLYICAILGYLTNAPVQTCGKGEVEEGEEGKELGWQIKDEPRQKRTRCLLCGTPCCSRSILTKHCKAQHTEATTFSQPFPCPECLHLGKGEFTIENPCHWSNHAESVHGKIYAPNWTPQPPSSQLSCTICSSELVTNAKLISHMNRHVQSDKQDWPASCRECAQAASTSVPLRDVWEWLEHCKADHIPSALLCALCGYLCSTASGLTRHTNLAHSTEFRAQFPCPACQRAGSPEPRIIDGLASWHAHMVTVHNLWGCVDTDYDVAFKSRNNYECPREDATIKRAKDNLKSEDPIPTSKPLVPDYMDEEATCSNPPTATSTTKHPHFDATDELAASPYPGSADENELPPIMNDMSLPPHRPACDIPMDLIDPSLRNDQLLPEPMEGVMATLISPPSPPAGINHDEPVCIHDGSDPSYAIDCILERWGRDLFLIKWWDDGSYWWVPRENILDEELLQKFEAEFKGFHLGVKVLGTRRRNRKMEYRVRWNGRPAGEDRWVPERQMNPDLVKEYKECKPLKKRAKKRKACY
ncbi:hypothetical protein F4821DRAFT_247161 [Hypoxylon rubiginosum]|uniref:Uncharacterized protein n=1 Tax=Hypoxylon rubiginosum TaxID=110542 RepID=A0ACC0CQ76_9PEZI|nr:hypothetical protein F4821DRAFT_247161 [Hypoxylon rubiginosum]